MVPRLYFCRGRWDPQDKQSFLCSRCHILTQSFLYHKIFSNFFFISLYSHDFSEVFKFVAYRSSNPFKNVIFWIFLTIAQYFVYEKTRLLAVGTFGMSLKSDHKDNYPFNSPRMNPEILCMVPSLTRVIAGRGGHSSIGTLIAFPWKLVHYALQINGAMKSVGAAPVHNSGPTTVLNFVWNSRRTCGLLAIRFLHSCALGPVIQYQAELPYI